jgi:hypothetical protein
MMATLYVRDCPSADTMRAHVLSAYDRATTSERDRGAAWYDDARDHARAIGDIAGVSMYAGAGVLAVLSPQVEWNVNLAEAYRVATAHADDDYSDPTPFVAFSRNVYRAYTILQAPEHVERIVCTPTSPKVAAFYRAIAGLPGGPVIDRHATRIATGYGYDAVTARTFYLVQSAYIAAALTLGILEHALQAAVWLLCKRELASTVGQLSFALA